MLAEELIKQLQTAIINHDAVRYDNGEDVLGPLIVYVDSFEDKGSYFYYGGMSPDIVVEPAGPGEALIRWSGW